METMKAGQSNNSGHLFLCRLMSHSKYSDQVASQVLHHLSCNLVENTWCQLWYQKLADNTAASLLAADCL